jgi:hypothetical protein
MQKIGFAEVLDSIGATDNRCSLEAYVFFRDALDYTPERENHELTRIMPSKSVNQHIGVQKPTHQRMAYCCERELPSHSARASRSIVSPSTFFCIVPSNPMTLSQSGLSPTGLSTVNNALPVGGNFSGSLGITRPWSISASIVTHRICMIISRRCRNKSPDVETPYRGVATTLVSIRGHMSRRSFGEGGFVVSKNKNALPGFSRQGVLN